MPLIDSSIWIAGWRGGVPAINEALISLIESNDASINPLILTELLQGALNSKHQEAIAQLLAPIPVLPLPNRLWTEAPKLYLRMRQKGVTITTMDCLIAMHAISERVPLWSADGIFQDIRAHSDLRLFQPPGKP
ncbi:MAG: PIN domain-containing protein [Deltaproteobacteria bacterium]|nr:PIN domain-containing protein [Deltaproteobacteria bacterium]